jgi:hypothetical protein
MKSNNMKVLKALIILSMVYSANASAVWVEKSAEYCRHHGFSGRCWFWELTAKPTIGGEKIQLSAGAKEPKVGDMRGTPPDDVKPAGK